MKRISELTISKTLHLPLQHTMKFFLLSSLLLLDNATSRMVDDGHVFGRSMHMKNSKKEEALKTKPVIQSSTTIPSNKDKVVHKKESVIPEKNKGPLSNTTTNKKPTTSTTTTTMKEKTLLPPPQKPKNPKVVEQDRPTKKPVTNNASIPTKKVTASNETTKPVSTNKKSIRAGQL